MKKKNIDSITEPYGWNLVIDSKRTIENIVEELVDLTKEQNKLLRRNTYYTGGGFLTGAVAIIISLIALFK